MATLTVTSQVRKPGPYPAGRRCGARDCGTVLSRYNPTSTCAPHGGWTETVTHPERKVEQEYAGSLLAEVLSDG